MTIWCLDQSENDLQSLNQSEKDFPETDKTAKGFLSSSRSVTLSEFDDDKFLENDLEISTPHFDQEDFAFPATLDDLKNEITIENEFEQFIDNLDLDVVQEEDEVFEYDFGQDDFESISETQTNPIITVGLAATESPFRTRERKNLLLDRMLSVPARLSLPNDNLLTMTAHTMNQINNIGSKGLDPRIGLSKFPFGIQGDSNPNSILNNIIGPQIPAIADNLEINQNLFQTRF